MILEKGQKVRIVVPNTPWFKDDGKTGIFVGMFGPYYMIYVEGSRNNG